jgi:5-formyltetrahydrofolate cyclo-ligase
MDHIKEKKREIRREVSERLGALTTDEISKRYEAIESRLFGFANFLESRIIFLYYGRKGEVSSQKILKRCLQSNKIVVLPALDPARHRMKLLKVDNLGKDLIPGPAGIPQPDPTRCKLVPIDRVDIAIVPGIAFDEKGGRVGTGEGYYDRLIPRLPATTRKVALSLEAQILPQVPMESHDRHVDIIITENRVIYKI